MISCSWSQSSVKEKYMHESIINNFNFDYVYNFFFDPEKVKGLPYKPRRSPSEKESIVVAERSDAAKKASSDKNIFYFEDFSTTAIGKNPIGWYAKASGQGIQPTVTTVAGTDNNWALIKGNTLIPNNLKKPLPKNFTLSFDVIVPENFAWGAKSLAFMLAKEKTDGAAQAFVRLRVRPGYGGNHGQGEMETLFPPGFSNGTKNYDLDGFSNNLKLNRLRVTLKKSGEGLRLLMDNKMVVDYPKGLPADILFNAISFEMSNSDGET